MSPKLKHSEFSDKFKNKITKQCPMLYQPADSYQNKSYNHSSDFFLKIELHESKFPTGSFMNLLQV